MRAVEKTLLRAVRYMTYLFIIDLQIYCALRWFWLLEDQLDSREFKCHAFICLTFDVVIFWAHIKASFFDPGFKAARSTLIGSEGCCKKCGAEKLSSTHHCRKCDRCVQQMDHHCFFTDNCIGKDSLRAFILFAFYTCLMCIYGVSMQLIFWCSKNRAGDPNGSQDVGFQGVFDLLTFSAFSLEWYFWGVRVRNYSKLLDFLCLQASLGFLTSCMVMLAKLLKNIKCNTSMVDEIKRT